MQYRYIVKISKLFRLLCQQPTEGPTTCLITEELIPGARRSGKQPFKAPDEALAEAAATVVATTGTSSAPGSAARASADPVEAVDPDVAVTCAPQSCCS